MSNAECYERMLTGDEFYNKNDIFNNKQTFSKSKHISKSSTCNTCIKSDVCMYKEELKKAEDDVKEIYNKISTNIIDISITCKKWNANINTRNK